MKTRNQSLLVQLENKNKFKIKIPLSTISPRSLDILTENKNFPGSRQFPNLTLKCGSTKEITKAESTVFGLNVAPKENFPNHDMILNIMKMNQLLSTNIVSEEKNNNEKYLEKGFGNKPSISITKANFQTIVTSEIVNKERAQLNLSKLYKLYFGNIFTSYFKGIFFFPIKSTIITSFVLQVRNTCSKNLIKGANILGYKDFFHERNKKYVILPNVINDTYNGTKNENINQLDLKNNNKEKIYEPIMVPMGSSENLISDIKTNMYTKLYKNQFNLKTLLKPNSHYILTISSDLPLDKKLMTPTNCLTLPTISTNKASKLNKIDQKSTIKSKKHRNIEIKSDNLSKIDETIKKISSKDKIPVNDMEHLNLPLKDNYPMLFQATSNLSLTEKDIKMKKIGLQKKLTNELMSYSTISKHSKDLFACETISDKISISVNLISNLKLNASKSDLNSIGKSVVKLDNLNTKDNSRSTSMKSINLKLRSLDEIFISDERGIIDFNLVEKQLPNSNPLVIRDSILNTDALPTDKFNSAIIVPMAVSPDLVLDLSYPYSALANSDNKSSINILTKNESIRNSKSPNYLKNILPSKILDYKPKVMSRSTYSTLTINVPSPNSKLTLHSTKLASSIGTQIFPSISIASSENFRTPLCQCMFTTSSITEMFCQTSKSGSPNFQRISTSCLPDICN